jgi:hypothetical protein
MSQMLGRATVNLLRLALFAVGWTMRFKKEGSIEAEPVDSTTDQGDLRMLHHEKAEVAGEIAMGVTAIESAGGL